MKTTSTFFALLLAMLAGCPASRAVAATAVNFAYGVTNSGSTVEEFTNTFPSPVLTINLPPGTYDVSATFGITLTAAPGDTAVFSLPTDASSYMKSFINGQDAGVDIGTATETTSGGTEVFSFAPVSSQYVLTSTGTTMSVTTDFDLSPGDSASFSGSFVVQTVPEPASLVLGLTAMGAFALLIFRSRRVRA
jgi:hypothetical protein